MIKTLRNRFFNSCFDNPISKIANPKWGGLVALVIAFVEFASGVESQEPKKGPRIGFLVGNPFSAVSQRIEAFRDGLRELGYVEGKNIVMEWRSADGNFGREPMLAAELVRLKVDVIVAVGVGETRASKEATASRFLRTCWRERTG